MLGDFSNVVLMFHTSVVLMFHTFSEIKQMKKTALIQSPKT